MVKVTVLISILGIILLLAAGAIIVARIGNEDVVGNLLIVEQDNEDLVYMLEIFEKKSGKIKPGERVSLIVQKEYITLKKQPS